MITNAELVEARGLLLERTVSFFAERPDVLGIFLAGSLPAGSADAYSDIDLRIIATPEEQVRLLNGRLDWPTQWLDVWIQGAGPSARHDLKLAVRLSPALANAFARSYVGLKATELDDAIVALNHVLSAADSRAASEV